MQKAGSLSGASVPKAWEHWQEPHDKKKVKHTATITHNPSQGFCTERGDLRPHMPMLAVAPQRKLPFTPGEWVTLAELHQDAERIQKDFP